MTESFLCKEFNFAEYLARVHSQTVCNFLSTHFLALALSLPIMVTFLITLSSPGELISFLNLENDSS